MSGDFRRDGQSAPFRARTASEHVVLRRAPRRAVLAPQVELVRRVEPDTKSLLVSGKPSGTGIGPIRETRLARRSRRGSSWGTVPRGERHLRAGGIDARHRNLQVQAVRERFVDQ